MRNRRADQSGAESAFSLLVPPEVRKIRPICNKMAHVRARMAVGVVMIVETSPDASDIPARFVALTVK
jgi:hypothetical protein